MQYFNQNTQTVVSELIRAPGTFTESQWALQGRQRKIAVQCPTNQVFYSNKIVPVCVSVYLCGCSILTELTHFLSER